MSIKLILLKSGEDIISDLSEMVTENGKTIGYFLKRPCIVKIKNFSSNNEETDEISKGAKVNLVLYPWMPLSKDVNIPIPSDWVVTVVDPVDELVSMYQKDVLSIEKNEESNITAE